MHPKDADRMAKSADPDQSLIWSTLFAQACLSENLGMIRYGHPMPYTFSPGIC